MRNQRRRRSRDSLILVGVVAILVVGLIGMEWLRPDASNQPKSIVTTWTDDPKTTRAFSWYTTAPVKQSVLELVEEGAAKLGEAGTIKIEGATRTIDTGNKGMQTVHEAVARDLQPGTTYYYRVGSGQADEWSKELHFTTEEELSEEEALTFLHVTDSQGITSDDFKLWGNTLTQAFNIFDDTKFIIHGGDLTEDPEDQLAWDAFFNEAPIVSEIPLLPVTGNHDELDGEAERFLSHFQLPNNGAAGSIPGTTYSFDYGPVHVVVMNTESNLKAQTKWLRQDLKNNTKEWIVVAMHRGAYGGNAYKKVQDWVDVFDEFKVDLVLQGHNHEYSRSYPLRNGKVTENGDHVVEEREGTVYVVTNAAGQKFNEKKDDQFYHQVHFQNEKQMFAGITITGNVLVYQAYTVDGELVDEFEIRH